MTGARGFRRRTLLGLVGLLVGSVLVVMAAPNLGAATVEGHPDADEPKTEKPTTSEKPDKPTTTTTVKPTTTTTVKPTTTTTVKPTTTTTVKPTTTTTVKPTTTTVKPTTTTTVKPVTTVGPVTTATPKAADVEVVTGRKPTTSAFAAAGAPRRPGGGLPTTGASSVPLALAGGVLFLGGAGLVASGRSSRGSGRNAD